MGKCTKCQNESIEVNVHHFFTYYLCHECGNYEFPYNVCCNSPEIIEIKVQQANSSWVRRKACKNCKSLIGKALPKGADFIDIPFLRRDKYLEYQEKYDKYKTEVYDILKQFREEHELKKEQIRQNEIKEHTLKYHQYLESPKWKNKALLVKKRDNNTCQACLSAPAEAVHHLTYERIFNEPLFDLVSICNNCHSLIHNK